MARYVTTEILGSQCIGDSRTVINTNFENLDTKIQTLSTNTLTLSTTSTVQFTEPFNSATRRIAAFVRPASIDSTHLASDSVTTAKLSAQAVTTDKIALSAVTTQTIANSAITAEKMSGGQAGTAPVYGCRAWFAFDATRDSSGATNQNNTNRFIYGSGNINSITRLSSNGYRVVFNTSMPSIGYTTIVNGNIGTLTQNDTYVTSSTKELSSFEMAMSYAGAIYNNSPYITGVVFA